MGFLLGAVLAHAAAVAAPPYLTGVVDDADSQVIEMPRLPGMWQRQVAWLAPEGSTVAPGDLVVRLDPGDLVAQEEAAQTDLEQRRLQAERRLAETMLAILDAQTAVADAESAVRLARIDAEIPAHATRRLDHDQDQLDLATAEQALARARATLADKKEQHAEAQPVTEMAIARAEAHAERLRDAIAQTEIHADRAGLFIHGENPFTGTKIFAGETLPPTIKIAEVASRNALRFRFWVHEADILKVPAKTEIVVTADAIPSLSVAATVDWTSKQATARTEWSQGGYFELLALPTETVPPEVIPGMAVMAEVRPATSARGERTVELPAQDRPVTIAASGIVISTDVLKFGAPPSRNWSLPISQIAEEGNTVDEGELLVQFDANMLDNRVRELAGTLAVSRSELASLAEQQAQETADEKVALATAESQATKANRKAEQPAELIPGIEYRKLIEQKRLANERLRRLRQRQPLSARVREAKRREREVDTQRLEIIHAAAVKELEALTIRAPRSGLVIIGTDQFGNKLDIGNPAHPGLAVVEIANERKLAVQAEIPEHLAARLAEGQRVRVAVDSAGGSELEGRVSSVANTVRRQSRQSQASVRDITVSFPVDAPKGLRLGMSVQIEVEVAVVASGLEPGPKARS